MINQISKIRKKKLVIAEIGVWKGAFCKFMLKRCGHSISKYYLIDPWRHLDEWNKPYNIINDKFEKIYKKLMKELENTGKMNKIRILRGTTSEVIDKIKDSELDLIYIDGDHTFNGITNDLKLCIPKVSKNGIVGGDDFVDKIDHHGSNYDLTMVKPVVKKYASENGIKLFSNVNQFCFRKK